MSKKTCSFIALNVQKQFSKNDTLKGKLKREIEKQILENKVSHFISSMALGVETLAAELIIELKTSYPYITLEVALPYEEQAANWKEEDRMRYFSLIEQCDKETLIAKQFTTNYMQHQNQYLIDHSDTIILIKDKSEIDIENHPAYEKLKIKDITTIEP